MSAGARTRATAGCVRHRCLCCPGNKTTQLAAAVGETGNVHAFERNRKRAATLRDGGARRSVRHRTGARGRFHRDGRKHRCRPCCCQWPCAILAAVVGGGAGGHAQAIEQESATDYWENVRRLQAQLKIAWKAFAYPHMRVVVYSTCSVHREENEDVVASLSGCRRVAPCHVPARLADARLPDAPNGELCVRAGEHDETHGILCSTV